MRTQIKQWNYLTGKLNNADICSRPSSFKILHSGSFWVLRPRFLYEQTVQKYSTENNDQVANIKLSKKQRANLSSLALNGNIGNRTLYILLSQTACFLKLKQNCINKKRIINQYIPFENLILKVSN